MTFLEYIQREAARCSWESRQQYASTGWKENDSDLYCWDCCEGLKGQQLAAADWYLMVEKVRDGRFSELDPFHRRALTLGYEPFQRLDWYEQREPLVRALIGVIEDRLGDKCPEWRALVSWELDGSEPKAAE